MVRIGVMATAGGDRQVVFALSLSVPAKEGNGPLAAAMKRSRTDPGFKKSLAENWKIRHPGTRLMANASSCDRFTLEQIGVGAAHFFAV